MHVVKSVLLVLGVSLIPMMTPMPSTASVPWNPMDLIGELVQAQQRRFALFQPEYNWHVGDHAEYTLATDLISGTMDMQITSDVDQGFWVTENLDLGIAGQHQLMELVDPADGHIIEMTLDGKAQTPPPDDPEQTIDSEQETITVQAGTFNVTYTKEQDEKTNDITQDWTDLTQIPIMGLAKTIQPVQQVGEVTAELVSFGFAPQLR